jgi:hypothetical protein
MVRAPLDRETPTRAGAPLGSSFPHATHAAAWFIVASTKYADSSVSRETFARARIARRCLHLAPMLALLLDADWRAARKCVSNATPQLVRRL